MKPGTVSLVGAGPGDPALITLAGLDRIREADVIVYDRLVSARLLDHAPDNTERIYVGKLPGDSHDQDAINALLIEKAREGLRVVRLKGGDPFVFGRGGEEAQALHEAGVPFEIVPGVTSAVAVPAYAGIPVTHRGLASSFAVITGHEAFPVIPNRAGGGPPRAEGEGADAGQTGSNLPPINWPHLATAVDTLVFLMGVKALPDIVANLTANGRAATTPVAVIHRGTTPDQQTVTGTLADIVERATEAAIEPPAITVVGEVVRLRETLAWFEHRPLFGKRVLITRTRKQASVLARLLAEEGAIPVELPAIEIEPTGDPGAVDKAVQAARSGDFAWVVFTSANAVDLVFEHLAAHDLDARVFSGVHFAAIGPATASSLARWGILADVVPEEYVAESVVRALSNSVMRGQRILLPRAESARDELITGLQALGASVTEIPIYRAAVPAEAPPEALADLREGRIDIVTFTASSTVRNLVSMLGDDAVLNGDPRPLIACIGPITAQTAHDLGLTVDVTATEYTVEGLVEALRAQFASE